MKELLFYSYPSCTSCRKTKKWLNSNQIAYRERHIFRDSPTPGELKSLLEMTSDGLDELLATRSETYKNLTVNIDEMPLSNVLQLLSNEPRLLRRPILTDGERIIIGHQPEALEQLKHSEEKMCAY